MAGVLVVEQGERFVRGSQCEGSLEEAIPFLQEEISVCVGEGPPQ